MWWSECVNPVGAASSDENVSTHPTTRGLVVKSVELLWGRRCSRSVFLRTLWAKEPCGHASLRSC